MHSPHDLDELAASLRELVGVMNSPRQDAVLLREAGVALDRALFPLLVRVGAAGSVGVVDLADHVGRDHSTVSRQLATLEESGLVARQAAARDARIREARITPAGREIVAAITTARRRALGALLADWSEGECRTLARLNRKLAEAMQAARRAASA